MKVPVVLLLTAATLALAGCARNDSGVSDAPVVSPAAARAAELAASKDPYAPLMRAVFGDDYLPAKGHAVEGIGDPDTFQKSYAPIYTGATSTRLPSGETVLVVTSMATDENGDENPALPDPGRLSLYVLRQQGGQWNLVRRHDDVAQLGRVGFVGDLRWVMPAQGRPVLAVEHHESGQGYRGTWLSLFDPSKEKVVDLTGNGIMTESDSTGACPAAVHCWSARATWRFEPTAHADGYDDLVLTIAGDEDEVADDKAEDNANEADAVPAPAKTHSLAGTARYVFQNGSYRLRDGANTLPSF